MLTLSRRTGESIIIFTSDGAIVVYLRTVEGPERCKIGIQAPASVKILRSELLTDTQKEELRHEAGNTHA